MAILVLDTVDVEEAHRYTASRYHCIQRHRQSYGWRFVCFGQEEDSNEEDLYFAMKFPHQKLSKYYTEVSPMTGMFLISAHMLDCFRKLRSFRKWDKGMLINPEDETSYTI